MRPGRVKKYLVWLVFIMFGLTLPLVISLFLYPEQTDFYQDWGWWGLGFVGVPGVVLALTAAVGLLSSKPRKDIPLWVLAFAFAGVVEEYSAMFFVCYLNPSGWWLLVAIMICGVALCVNMGMIFLVQTWITDVQFELKPHYVMPTHMLFAIWIYITLISPGSQAFVLISAAVILATVPLAMLVEILVDKHNESIRKRLDQIYS